ncbi:MAG TPA: type II toxin-antitoxin system VapC family toxin [Cyclobacteriaceae bacterium]|nr:type II toxin-antitoxin system VapC family toxin [Cyclobacteriaceae bacterium]
MAESKIICDTDVMIDYFDAHQHRHAATKILLEEKIGLDNIVLSAISKMELITGALNKTELGIINKKLHRFDILLIDPAITELSLTLLQTYRLSHGLSMPDSLIAATVLNSGLEFFTYNIKDFKFIAKLKLFSD